jgi:glycosyltransferase involved in cell wall biosynthesis
MKKKLKIGWVADYDVTHPGGAQQTNQEMINYGKYKLGYEIDYILSKINFSNYNLSKYDFFILNNIVHFQNHDINNIVENYKYIRYEHDYDAATYIHKWPNLYKNSLLNIFLSPLHLKEHEEILKDEIKNSACIPSPIDSNLFRVINPKSSRIKNSVLMVGNLVPAKGLNNVMQYLVNNPKKVLYTTGFNMSSEFNYMAKKFAVNYTGQTNYSLMPGVYNSYESFIHLPEWKEPFGRSVMEAYLCGCDLILNDNVGCLSYGWNFKNLSKLKKILRSESLFWKTVAKYV